MNTTRFREELLIAGTELAAAIDRQARADCGGDTHAAQRAQGEVERCREYRDGVSALYRAALQPGIPVGARLVSEMHRREVAE